MKLITYPILASHSSITHFCTTRIGGVSCGNYGTFNISPYSGDLPENQQRNLQLLCNKINIVPNQLVFPYQTHSDIVKIIDEDFLQLSTNNRTEFLNGVDALITQLPAICIGVTTADCVPILIYDPVNKAIAAVHAGWRGTNSRIVQKTIQSMQTIFGTNSKDVFVSIGVSISPEAYNVGEDLLLEFENSGFPTELIFSKKEKNLYLDLWTANKWLLTEMDVTESQIEIANICSYSNADIYFSARKLGLKSGRMLSGIMLK
ncbi:MAG: peptidoglycan editing factor PgeF [Paludibacter sp.]